MTMPRKKSTPLQSLAATVAAIDERTKRTETDLLEQHTTLLRFEAYTRSELAKISDRLASMDAKLDRLLPPPAPPPPPAES